jgi:hypothetical protein
MNVTATYTQRTSLAPILQTTSGASIGSGAAVVPVTAVMNLTGPLLLPVIKLALEFDDAPSSLQNDLASFIALLRNDEQELNRQVFSLLVFRTLSQQNAFTSVSLSGQGNAVQNSLGQIISSQLGALTSQIDQNLEIDFNINGLTADQLQALQVRLSYSFLNGRLRLTREGGISNTSTTTTSTGITTTNQSSLLGDFSLEYFLRPDGKFRAKLRYETTPRTGDLINNQNQNQARAGISLLHTEEFNSLRELFGREKPTRRARNRERAREVMTVEEDPKTSL